MKAHPSITVRRLMEACERYRMTLDNPGLCVTCGNEQAGVEPGARKYECEACCCGCCRDRMPVAR
jgi:hypothetical protein